MGLDWSQAKTALESESWRQTTDQNLKDLYSMGLWGVPSVRYKDTHVWGQDRLWCIESAMLAPYLPRKQNAHSDI